ncbi:hypothetical protein [Polycladidibacter stylochi]|uniref:hypothetical protein n=1 Tax=Polycladidibacter stylochi TaxID=1807766 RepID=UPI000831C97E|nr:hypothetical protein [Pseudovibrio stylochi]
MNARLLLIGFIFIFSSCVAHAAVTKTQSIRITPPNDGSTQINIGDNNESNTDFEEGIAPTPQVIPEVLYDLDQLPAPVAALRNKLIAVARSGDMDALRPLFQAQKTPPQVAYGDVYDPVDYLKESSGDGEGRELLAIMLDTLDSGYVRVSEPGKPVVFVWPYHARFPLTKLNSKQTVEMYRIITAADFYEMQDYGMWTFYHIAIAEDGTLREFIAGD